MFTEFASRTAQLAGKPLTFLIAVAVVLVWAVSGPFFGFSDTWQLVINTATTIVTFLMVFLIQNTQNRDTLALQLKLAELIIAMHGARTTSRPPRIFARKISNACTRPIASARRRRSTISRASAATGSSRRASNPQPDRDGQQDVAAIADVWRRRRNGTGAAGECDRFLVEGGVAGAADQTR